MCLLVINKNSKFPDLVVLLCEVDSEMRSLAGFMYSAWFFKMYPHH